MDDPLFGPSPAAPPAVAPPATVHRRLLGWDAQGNPVLTTVPLVTPAVMQDLYNASAALPYEGPEERYKGLSCAEVIVRRQIEEAAKIGDDSDRERVLDRLMGKPKQKTESLRINASYEDFIKSVARGVTAPPPDIVDAEVIK